VRRNPLTVAKDTAALAVTQVTANLEVLTTAMDKPTNANLLHTTVRMRLVIALVQTNRIAELTSSVDPVAAEVLTEMVTPRTQISQCPLRRFRKW